MSKRYQTSQVTITKGTKFIEVQDVIGWIVNKISPLSDEPETLIHFKKCIQRESGNELLALTSDDYALLTIIFESLPMGDTFPYGLSYDEFNQYREVFESSPKKPDWALHAEFQNKKLLSQQRQQLTAKQHISLIEQANKEKEITIRSDRLVPLDRAAYASVISIRDAKNYLSTYGIRLVKTDKAEKLMKTGLYRLHDYGLLQANQVEVQAIADPSASDVKQAGYGHIAGVSELLQKEAPEVGTKAPPLAHWKLRVQEHAYQVWQRVLDYGGTPSVSNTKDKIAKWCVDNDVRTDSGNVHPTAEYLRTHVLSSKHWKNRPTKRTPRPEQPEQTEQA